MLVTQVRYDDGLVEGTSDGAVRGFFSLPYAAPLTDERRFRAPQPVERWSGLRDATRPGPSAPQNPPADVGIDLDGIFGPPVPDGPDYLTLNVWTPEGAQGRPVMVFIHGGSFVGGSKDAALYDGRYFARDAVVCVTINYRLGIEGFLPVEGAETNLGLRDMIAALAWVRANIAAFGGDPANVTLFGESGGAWCIAALMTSPLAQGLFHRAICQSGHIRSSRDPQVAARLVRRVAKRLKVAPTRAGLLSKSTAEILAAQEWVMKPSLWFDMRDDEGWDASFGITRFLHVHGDDVLPLPTPEALAAGAGKDVQLLIGTTSEEARLFFVPGNAIGKIGPWTAKFFLGRVMPKAKHALRAYGLDEKGARAGEVLTRAMTDLMFRWPSRRTAELHAGRSHVYEFEWRSPAFDGELGSAHAIEIPFVFDNLASASGRRSLLGENPPQALADSMHALWIRFATDGHLPWPEYDEATRQVWSLTRQTAEHEPPMPAAAFLP